MSQEHNVKCWDCLYCDKESVLVEGKWEPTRTGFCTAEGSAANGPQTWYQKVYANTIQPLCHYFFEKPK